MSQLEPLMEQNFLEYASYVIIDRAIPDIRDGCKPVQRRILYTLHQSEDGKFHKVANIIGETMKLHPHGDASIYEALVVLANKGYFIEKQGNFGNVLTGHAAAASRYIECRLTPFALETLFNPSLTQYQISYDGRRQEPMYLPAKLPVILMLGTEGIAVGMATKILPHNLAELLEAQMKILRNQAFELHPDFIQGGSMDVSAYQDGQGKVKVRAALEAVGDKKVVIREIAYSTTTESLIASIESAIQKGKVKISSINDFTTDKVEIELILTRGVYADEVIPQLYAYTDCEVSISPNMVVIQNRHPCEMPVSDILKVLTQQLQDQIQAELEYEQGQLLERQHWLTLEQIFIEHKIYKRIEKAKTLELLQTEVYQGMDPFAHVCIRPMNDKDVERLLDLKIRRISAYDIEKYRKEVDAITQALRTCRKRLSNLTSTTLEYLQGLLQKYGKRYPRRTRIETFQSIDRKAVARQNIKLGYDPDSGFFGSDVKGSHYQMVVSEYDLILAITRSGTFRVMTPPSKIFLGETVYCDLFDPKQGTVLTLVYRDSKKYAFAKKVHIQKFIRNKEYRLINDAGGRVDHISLQANPGTVQLSYTPAPRQRVQETSFDLSTLACVNLAARGTRLAPKPVSKVKIRSSAETAKR